MLDWLTQGPPNAFWLSGFFFPQGFLTGALQNHARKYRIPIDSLTFSFNVSDMRDRKELEKAADDGVFVYGLYLDGARWDMLQHQLADSRLSELFSPLPLIHFIPTNNITTAATSDPHHYSCPVYKTSVRAGVLSTTGHSTNYVLTVQLPAGSHEPDYWVLKGAAILCQLDQ